jgi:hypothetical protein
VTDMGNDARVASVVNAECAGGAHHWLIPKPDGPVSEGVCKWCNARRDFTNEVTRRYASQIRLSQGSSSGKAA